MTPSSFMTLGRGHRQKAAEQLGHAPRRQDETVRDLCRRFADQGLLALPEGQGEEVAL
jgi:hypothetical protein